MYERKNGAAAGVSLWHFPDWQSERQMPRNFWNNNVGVLDLEEEYSKVDSNVLYYERFQE